MTDPAAGASPPWGGKAAYDPTDNETVYFGGCLNVACSILSDQTWVFVRGTWFNETDPFDAPAARIDAAMDFDGNMQSVLLFGGYSVSRYLGDTWLFRAGMWTNVTNYGPGPSARYDAQMAFDPQPEENGSVLFGGYSVTGYMNDTWSWEGAAGWVPLSPSIPPPPLCCGAMAYDAADGYIVLYGGYTGYVAVGQTWELYSGQWWAVSPASPPVARYFTSMVYVTTLLSGTTSPGILLFGGDESGTEVNDTWWFVNGTWIHESTAQAPPPEYYDTTSDGTGSTALAVGGYSPGIGSQTWAYEFAPESLLGANLSAAEVGESVLFTADVSSGTAPYRAAFNFGDGSSAFVSGSGPELSVAHAFAHNGTYDVVAKATDAVGAQASPVTLVYTVASGPRITANATPSAGDVGLPITFKSYVVSPGTPPLRYLWTFGDGATATTQNASHSYLSIGSYSVRVEAIDTDHSAATASLTAVVAPDPTVAVAASTSHPAVGTAVTFWANVSGGTGPYIYAWRFADGGSNGLPVSEHSFTGPGTYSVQVWVNDSVGGVTHGTVTVTAYAPPSSPNSTSSASPSNSSASAPWWFLVGIALIVAVVAAAAVVLAITSRRRRQTRSRSPVVQPAPSSPPSPTYGEQSPSTLLPAASPGPMGPPVSGVASPPGAIAPVPSTVPPPTSPTTSVPPAPRFCSNCGSVLKSGANFCPSCGTKVNP